MANYLLKRLITLFVTVAGIAVVTFFLSLVVPLDPLSAIAGLVLARRVTVPIRALQDGAARIGSGDLSSRIDIATGDELEALAGQFNDMTAELQSSYATLERRVEERTHELTESLEQQTATSEVLRAIASTPGEAERVLDTIAETARRNFPHLRILARVADRPHAYELLRAGIDDVFRETFGSALDLGAAALSTGAGSSSPQAASEMAARTRAVMNARQADGPTQSVRRC